MKVQTLAQYSRGSLVRVKQICGDPASGKPGLLPIHARTWYSWIKQGKVPQGVLLGDNVRAWPIETVLALAAAPKPAEAAHV